MIEICSNGATNLIQDDGRKEWLAHGISTAGAMDAEALRIANALVGNEESCAAVEINMFPFRARFLVDAAVAWTGANSMVTVNDANYPSWWTAQIRAGDLVTVAPPRSGSRVYLSCGGGIDVPKVLGSRSTDLKAGFGGLEGRGLRRGDCLPIGAPVSDRHCSFGVLPTERIGLFDELNRGAVTLRFVAAAEYDAFTYDAQSTFESKPYIVSGNSNRTGYRLTGEALKLCQPLELLSYGIVPGTIQVPPDGQPIIQLADANTCGGYPKIGTIIEEDLWRLAQVPPNTQILFEEVSVERIAELTRRHAAERSRLLKMIEGARRGL